MMEELDVAMLEPRAQFDVAFVGYVSRFGMEPIACYDYELVIGVLVGIEMTYEEAEEYFHYNIIGAWVGDDTPCYISQTEL
tara:strand:+ start:845 stop:1087 length:243 start_codon:yes stop_codon:yes gene_type:complete